MPVGSKNAKRLTSHKKGLFLPEMAQVARLGANRKNSWFFLHGRFPVNLVWFQGL